MRSVCSLTRIRGAARLVSSWIQCSVSPSALRSIQPLWSPTTCPGGRLWSWPSGTRGNYSASWLRTGSDLAPLPISTTFCNLRQFLVSPSSNIINHIIITVIGFSGGILIKKIDSVSFFYYFWSLFPPFLFFFSTLS